MPAASSARWMATILSTSEVTHAAPGSRAGRTRGSERRRRGGPGTAPPARAPRRARAPGEAGARVGLDPAGERRRRAAKPAARSDAVERVDRGGLGRRARRPTAWRATCRPARPSSRSVSRASWRGPMRRRVEASMAPWYPFRYQIAEDGAAPATGVDLVQPAHFCPKATRGVYRLNRRAWPTSARGRAPPPGRRATRRGRPGG